MAGLRRTTAILLAVGLVLPGLAACASPSTPEDSEVSSGPGDSAGSGSSESPQAGSSDSPSGSASQTVQGSAEVVFGAAPQTFELEHCVSASATSVEADGSTVAALLIIEAKDGAGRARVEDSASDENSLDGTVGDVSVESDGTFTITGTQDRGGDFTVNGTCGHLAW